MNQFHVKYSNGKEQIHTTDDTTVELFCNSHFGSAWETAKEHGASVVMTEVGSSEVNAEAELKAADEAAAKAFAEAEAAKLEADKKEAEAKAAEIAALEAETKLAVEKEESELKAAEQIVAAKPVKKHK